MTASGRTFLAIVLVATAACGSNSGPSGPTTPTVTVVSLAIAGATYFTHLAQVSQLTATATLSDASTQMVTETAFWQSSRSDIVTVSAAGQVTAVGPGVSRVTATFGGASASADVVVPLANPVTRTIRMMYVVPSNRDFNPTWREGIQKAFINVQAWYRDQLGGPVFTLYDTTPDECRMPRDESYYGTDTWGKVLADVQRCAPVRSGAQTYVWNLFVDVLHTCNAPGRLGAGTIGLAMGARGDMQGLAGEKPVQGDCGPEPDYGYGRFIGGLAHEVGHSLGLNHPPGCDAGEPSCDSRALMWSGYSLYPNTYLRADDKALLAASTYIRRQDLRLWDTEGLPR
jgi:hypothetical protein